MNKKVIIPLAVVVLLALGVLLYMFVLRDTAPAPLVLSTFQAGEQIVTNIYSENGKTGALLKVVCVLFYDQSYEESLNTQEVIAFQVRDQVRRTLRSMTVELVSNVDNEDLMRDIIITDLNTRMNVDYFKDVMFLDIVIQ